MNPNTQFSFMHHLGVPSVHMQSLWLLGFMMLEWWRRRTDGHTDIDIYYNIFFFLQGLAWHQKFYWKQMQNIESPSTKQKGNDCNELSGKTKTWTQALSSFMTFGGKVYAGESPEQVFLPICLLRGTENNLSKKTVSCRINNVEWVQVYYCLNQRM